MRGLRQKGDQIFFSTEKLGGGTASQGRHCLLRRHNQDLHSPSHREAVLLPAKAGKRNDHIMHASALKSPLPPFRKGGIDFLAPFGAALGNPEMAGRQTVRARTKNASFPNRKPRGEFR